MSMVAAFARRAPKSVLGMFSQRTAAVNATANSDIFKTTMQTQQVRHAGASAIAAGLAAAGLGGVAQGLGTVFASLVVGTARNPAIKDDLFTYAMMGIGFVELIMFVSIGFAVVLMTSE